MNRVARTIFLSKVQWKLSRGVELTAEEMTILLNLSAEGAEEFARAVDRVAAAFKTCNDNLLAAFARPAPDGAAR